MDLSRFLVEVRRPEDGHDGPPASIDAIRDRARGMAATGEPVRILRSVYVPEDDAWFLLVEAASTGLLERLFQSQRDSTGAILPALVAQPQEDRR